MVTRRFRLSIHSIELHWNLGIFFFISLLSFDWDIKKPFTTAFFPFRIVYIWIYAMNLWNIKIMSITPIKTHWHFVFMTIDSILQFSENSRFMVFVGSSNHYSQNILSCLHRIQLLYFRDYFFIVQKWPQNFSTQCVLCLCLCVYTRWKAEMNEQ